MYIYGPDKIIHAYLWQVIEDTSRSQPAQGIQNPIIRGRHGGRVSWEENMKLVFELSRFENPTWKQ